MTIFAAVVAGFFTFVLGQIFVKLIVEPVSDFKRHIALIAHSLIEFAALLSNLPLPKKKTSELQTQFRQLASQLQATFYLIPRYEFTARLFGLPSQQAVHTAARKLIGLSNSVVSTGSDASTPTAYDCQEVCEALGIYVPPEEHVGPPGSA